jgi:exodeoxyribonuclease V alpha subunit
VSQVALKELGTNVVVEAEAATDFTLTDEQRDAIRLTLEQPVCVLTGGPGTGKTTILHTLLCALGMLDLDVALASPTGRAAKRMEEATGWPASTLHRLLGFGREGVWDFYHDEQTPLDEEFIVVDEASMLDNTLAAALVRAIRTGSHLLLVGDVDQLPSVGAGNVLRDIIESGIVPVARLTQIHRQAEGNGVVSAAWRINNGSMPDLKNTTPHFAFVAEDTPDRIASAIVDLAVNQMPDLGYEADDIQVLAPIKRGAAGVWKLNEMLQDAFNPASLSGAAPVPGTSFRIGDRVMQLVNNYEKTVFNGDMGTLVAHDANRDVVWVTFDGREVSFERGEIRDNLVLAYAITVHKSQGSEYPVVIVPVTTSHWIMLQRNLLYTAITRASERVVLVGTSKAIAIAVKTATVQHRYTLLAGRLKHLGDDKTPL